MKNINLKALIPVIVAMVLFVGLTFIYFSPMLKGKIIVQSDMVSNAGMAKETVDFRAKYNEEPLWSNSMFGGMPTYQFAIIYPGAIMSEVRDIFLLGLDRPASMVYNYMICFFILLLVLRVNPWLSIVGAIAFAFSAYNFIIIDAGHVTKAYAIGFMAPVFAGVILVMRGKYLLGGAITSFFLSLELFSNHVQITYYLMLFILVYVAFEYFALFKEKKYSDILKTIGVFVLVILIAFTSNISNLLNTMDYAKYTIRGQSELTDAAHNKTSGLDRDYVVQWSMGVSETMTLMVPGFKGLSSTMRINENKNALKNVDERMRENIGSLPQYWGDQPFTYAPYSGAIIVFLFVLGLFIVEGRIKWALLVITVLSFLLSWGKNFMPLTNFFLDYVPVYNKFRAVSTILILAEFALPILAILALDRIIRTPGIMNQKIKLAFINKELKVLNVFLLSFALTGGLSLLYYLIPDLVSFSSSSDASIYDSIAKNNGVEIAQQFIDNIESARKELFKSGAARSFLTITLAALFIWLFLKAKINSAVLISILGLVILFDLWTIDKNFINDKNFVNKKEYADPFPETVADKAILEDKDPSYRVLNIAVSPFMDASTSYRHKSIGGYHPAKLRRYQDLIDKHLQSSIEEIYNTLRSNPSDSSLRVTFSKQGVLNMLNTRYIIYNPSAPPLQNRYALGNAWFVEAYKYVKDADEEIAVLEKINPAETAIVDERFKEELDGFQLKKDDNATIRLSEYKPNHLKYISNTNSEQLALFSEIYYEDGWNAYIDGNLTSHFRANYVLRGLKIPSGKHTVEFKFEPSNFYIRDKITLVSSCILLLGLCFALVFEYIRKS